MPGAQCIALVADGWYVLGPESYMHKFVSSKQDLERHDLACGQIHQFAAFTKVHLNQCAAWPIQRIKYQYIAAWVVGGVCDYRKPALKSFVNPALALNRP